MPIDAINFYINLLQNAAHGGHKVSLANFIFLGFLEKNLRADTNFVQIFLDSRPLLFTFDENKQNFNFKLIFIVLEEVILETVDVLSAIFLLIPT